SRDRLWAPARRWGAARPIHRYLSRIVYERFPLAIDGSGRVTGGLGNSAAASLPAELATDIEPYCRAGAIARLLPGTPYLDRRPHGTSSHTRTFFTMRVEATPGPRAPTPSLAAEGSQWDCRCSTWRSAPAAREGETTDRSSVEQWRHDAAKRRYTFSRSPCAPPPNPMKSCTGTKPGAAAPCRMESASRYGLGSMPKVVASDSTAFSGVRCALKSDCPLRSIFRSGSWPFAEPPIDRTSARSVKVESRTPNTFSIAGRLVGSPKTGCSMKRAQASHGIARGRR